MTEYKYDIAAIGEALIDMTPVVNDGQLAFTPNPGGAPLNLLAMAAGLGRTTAFIGKVGHDAFGRIIQATLKEQGIHDGGLILSDAFNTTLAFVHLGNSGERSFSFYRKESADVMLTKEEINWKLIDGCRIFHFGSLSLTQEPVRTAVTEAVRYARSRGKLITYDPNYRPLLWESEEAAKAAMLSLLPAADILKVSEEECRLLTGIHDLSRGAEVLSKLGPKLVLVTQGEEGASYRYGESSGHIRARRIRAVDTTGCGDAFFGAFLARFQQSGRTLDDLTYKDIEEMMSFATSAGTLTALKHGGIPSLPDEASVRNFMAAQGDLR